MNNSVKDIIDFVAAYVEFTVEINNKLQESIDTLKNVNSHDVNSIEIFIQKMQPLNTYFEKAIDMHNGCEGNILRLERNLIISKSSGSCSRK